MQNFDIKTFWLWLAQSSVNPGEVALSVKGFFSLSIVQTLFNMLGMFGIHPTFTLALAGQDAYTFVYSVLMAVSDVIIAYGLIRKWMVYAHSLVPSTSVVAPAPAAAATSTSTSSGI